MRPTISQVRAWRPEQMMAAASALARRVDEFDDAMDVVARASDEVSHTWRGSAADRARERIGVEATIGNRVAVAGLALADVLNNGAAAIRQSRGLVLGLEFRLRVLGVTVGEDGEIIFEAVRWPDNEATAAALRSGLAELDAADRELAELLDGALQRFADASKYTARQDPSCAEILTRMGQVPGGAAGLSALWRSLPAAYQADLLLAMPELGTRAGMPAATRDFYNREALEGLVASSGAERDRLAETERALGARAEAGDPAAREAWPHVKRQLDGAQTRAAGYEAVAAQLAVDPRALLMDIDRHGRGAIALNNPDTATHVTTLVPGAGTTLSRIAGDVGRARAMLKAAEDVAPGTAHSVIAWAGYDAPPDLIQAADRGYAERGAEALRDFQSGLRASHEGEASHNTVVGHSYGTTQIGAAASHGRTLDADAVVFVASPGTTVGNVGELSLTGVRPADIGDHIYATKAATDPVPLYANMGGVVNRVLDVGAAASLASPGGLGGAILLDQLGDRVGSRVFGPFDSDPTAEAFGARTFTSAPGEPGPWMGYNTDTHGRHWEVVDGVPSQSLQNIAYIMANQGHRIS